jgi:hypothetical protein
VYIATKYPHHNFAKRYGSELNDLSTVRVAAPVDRS